MNSTEQEKTESIDTNGYRVMLEESASSITKGFHGKAGEDPHLRTYF